MSSIFPDIIIRGLFHRPAEVRDLVLQLPIGTRFALKRDASNRFDANAIEVYHKEWMVGFIGKEKAAWIAPEMDDAPEHEWIAELIRFSEGNSAPYLYVDIYPEAPEGEAT